MRDEALFFKENPKLDTKKKMGNFFENDRLHRSTLRGIYEKACSVRNLTAVKIKAIVINLISNLF